MTDNLPARFDAGDTTVPMSDAPLVALAFALGYAVARPQSADMFGPFLAVCEELMARRPDPAMVSEWTRLLSLLPPTMARNLSLLYEVQRGQRWNRTGSRHGTNPTDTGNR